MFAAWNDAMAALDTHLDQGTPQFLAYALRTGPAQSAVTRGMPVTVKRLDSFAPLSSDDLKILGSLKGRTVKAGSRICAQPADPESASLILSGWCARVSPERNDQQQITGIMIPGDAFGLGASPWAGDRLGVLTLTSCVLVDANPLRQLVRLRSPLHARLIEACHHLAWLQQTYALNQIVRLAGRNGYQRVAHLIVELYTRMEEVGLIRNGTFAMPLAQQTVADVLGLSKVHLNRVARQLKREGLADFRRGALCVPDLPRLADIAGFDLPPLCDGH